MIDKSDHDENTAIQKCTMNTCTGVRGKNTNYIARKAQLDVYAVVCGCDLLYG